MTLDELDQTFQFLREGLPLERIAQEKFFYNGLFYINKDVLIPRNETEVLVDHAINYCGNNSVKNIFEVGVGSGCILLSILKEVHGLEKAIGIDISEEALDVFKINYFRMKKSFPSSATVEALQGDRLKNISLKADLIVSNPPYIDREKDRHKVHWQTDRYEPEIALYLNNESYNDWFDLFFGQVKRCLNPQGTFFMEGHEDKWEDLLLIAEKHFYKIEVLNDLAGAPRFLMAGVK